MALKLYNTLTRRKEIFKPLQDKKVGFYTCGPTVYNYAHLGNLRTYIFEDILKRVLQYNGFQVKHIMNITDVDDKTIKGSQENNQGLKEFTDFYLKAFLKDIKALNIQLPVQMPRATQYIPEMVALIKKLLKKGYAYESNGSIYFDISKFPDYGKLAQLKKQDLRKGASGRILKDEYKKDQVNDFVLWKAWQPADGQVFWQTEIGKGRPGWHIECSVMSMKHLGKTFDIHAGAIDLIFPHHTNEIAQSEAASGKKFVKYWVHGGFLTIDKQRMAKSEKNFLVLNDLFQKKYNPLAFRYLCLTAHYRSILNFTWQNIQTSQKTLNNLYQIMAEYPTAGSVSAQYEKQFLKIINDDLDMPQAIALVWQIIKDKKVSAADKKATLIKFDQVLGLDLDKVKKEKLIIPQEIKTLVQKREKLRQEKNWQEADQIRKQIEAQGYLLKDTAQGPKLSAKN